MAISEAPAIRVPASRAASGRAGVAALAAAEIRIGIRSLAFRLVVILAVFTGWSVGGAVGRGAALSIYAAGDAAWKYFGLVVIAWMAIAAVSDSVLRTEALVLSKPQPSERLLLAKFTAAYVQVLLALAALFVAAAASRLVASGSLAGFSQYLPRYVASAGALFFLAAGSYAMSALARTPIAGAVVGLYWVLTLAGRNFVPKPGLPEYSQNLVPYVCIGIFFLCIALWFYRRKLRGGRPTPGWIQLTAVASVVVAALLLWRICMTGYDPQIHTQATLDSMSYQSLVLGMRSPGFRLPDSSGKLVSLADYPDRILVVALFAPGDDENVEVLDRLEDIERRYGARGVQPIAICLSEDASSASLFGRADDVSYPVVQDWGTHNAEKPVLLSPTASAFQITSVPYVVITDRRRIVREALANAEAYSSDALNAAVERRLAQEPH